MKWTDRLQESRKQLQESRKQRAGKKIDRIAHRLYRNRIRLGRQGDQHSDWQMAEQIAKSPHKQVLFAIHQPFIVLEKSLWEPVLHWADNQALLSLLGVVSNVGIIIAVVTYVGTEKQRRDAEVFNAWQTITSAYGQTGSGGRIQALEFLNASPGANWRRKFPWICIGQWCPTWPAERLDGINLAVDKAGEEEEGGQQAGVYLTEVQLPNASLSSANLQRAILFRANLQGVDLRRSNLQGVDLGGGNLQGADLGKTNLQEAILWDANLQRADLKDANLQGALLLRADFTNANIATQQLTQAKLCYTILPKRIDLDPNRDCKTVEEEGWPIEFDLIPNPTPTP